MVRIYRHAIKALTEKICGWLYKYENTWEYTGSIWKIFSNNFEAVSHN